MIDILNLCNINAACVGNHDFDFGIETLSNLLKISKFPWLLSNISDASTGKRFAGTLSSIIIDHCGLRVSFKFIFCV